MRSAPDLVLFTIAYPFGNACETFLETEIEVLADRFRRVYVLPSRREDGRRPLPAGVDLVEMDWLDGPRPGERRRAALVSVEAARALLSTLLSASDRRPYLRAPRTYLENLARNVRKLRSLAGFVREQGLANAVFYDYWFENSTLALALLRQTGAIETAVCRVHGFDLHDERWEAGAVPFREAKAGGLDAIYAVSAYGADYLGERIPGFRSKLSVQRLGVRDPGRAGPPPADSTPLVVTCGALNSAKRVHLVPKVLAGLRRPLRWLHLGDGPERQRVVEAAARLPGTISWELRGHVDNREVLELYGSRHVDALLSVSASEGLPVSMMEAQSYGIPIVAQGVGGVPEIVDETTGVLLPPDATPAEIRTGLEAALEPGRFESDAVRASFLRRFDADANYNRFVDALLTLHTQL